MEWYHQGSGQGITTGLSCRYGKSASGETAKILKRSMVLPGFADNGHLPDFWEGSAPAYPGDRDVRKLPHVGAALNRRRSHILGF